MMLADAYRDMHVNGRNAWNACVKGLPGWPRPVGVAGIQEEMGAFLFFTIDSRSMSSFLMIR